MYEDAKQLISQSKNIYVIPGQSTEALASSLALFYTLREQGKNVNVVIEKVPENLQFLAPGLDFVSYPKNFVISVPKNIADISQIYYEKNDDALKIHLTIEKGTIKKESLACYFAETKPDVIVTVGVADYQKELEGKLDSFGFLLDSPVVDIDNKPDNKKFGTINIVEEKSLPEMIEALSGNANKESSLCLLTALVAYTDNFTNSVSAEIFELAAQLMKKGADLPEVLKHLSEAKTQH